MKNEESIFFSDPSFLFEAYPNRVSSVIALEEAQKALHEELEIKYFYEGSATLLIGTQTVEVKAGDVVVINPYEFHTTLDGGGETPGKYHLFMIGLDFFSGDGTDVPDLRHLLLGGQIAFKTHFPYAVKIGTLLQILLFEYGLRSPYYRLTVRGLLMQIFAHLLREGVRDGKSPVPHKDVIRHYEVIEPALRAIRDEYARAFTVDELAALCRVSKYHFCRVFKDVMGQTAMQYLCDYRLKIADAMLTNTSHSVSQIAAQCGFESENYFGRCFKRRYGIPPGWRRMK